MAGTAGDLHIRRESGLEDTFITRDTGEEEEQEHGLRFQFRIKKGINWFSVFGLLPLSLCELFSL